MYDPTVARESQPLHGSAARRAGADRDATVQAIDSAQMRSCRASSAKAQSVATQMAPMQMDNQKIMARCGDNEDCISREVQKMGSAMAQDPNRMAAMNAARRTRRPSGPGRDALPGWRPTAQKGTYAIEELVKVSVDDPICTSKPRHRCSREETRRGSGDIPVPPSALERQRGCRRRLSAVELVAQKGALPSACRCRSGCFPTRRRSRATSPTATYDTPSREARASGRPSTG